MVRGDNMTFYEKVVAFINSITHFLSMPNYSPSFTGAVNFINFALYFIPVNTLLTIFALYIAINIISFFIRIIKTVWDVIPAL